MLSNTNLVWFALAITSVILWVRRRPGRNLPLPPGPKPDPLLGHLRMIPGENQPDVFSEWAKIYGDVMYLEVLGRKMVILDKIEDAKALLDNRGANYSCRPKIATFDIMGYKRFLAFMPYGAQFIKHRKMVQQYFGKKESLVFTPGIAEEARLLVKNLHQSASGRHLDYIRRFTVSCIMRAAFGHQVKSDDDIFLAIGHQASYGINNCGQGGNNIVDFFPWLRHFPSWFPGTYYADLARSCYQNVRDLHDVTVDFVRNGMVNKTVEKCFVSDQLEELGGQDNPDLELEDIKGAAAAIFIAGEDTAYVTISVFLLAMVLNPECQRRAYEEIISVVGQGRLPDLSDRGSLPYLECIMQETYRWHPVASFVPHRALDDDIYKGMFIPKGAIVFANNKSMAKNERVYHSPTTFDPVRYLPAPEGRGEPHLTSIWGYGRRICPGRHFADIVIWTAMACILATLEILPPKDGKGNVVLPELKPTDGIITGIAPFNFEVRARSEKATSLIVAIE
ncbi:hypothetical protein E1B28_005544 [Marasmius oreades]|uniref:Cytochrome P450 n=1 Tax=Marasmius oreades TaxID=181124 RepID=A0A9P7S3F7_9AGAR|nr:uncharacterized protein E1B28_005544 [Marasmius oreades]KAG7094724.1 hypothetical protein E1B28_005544 [Marasmius oreades]